MLNEVFNIKKGMMPSKDGRQFPVAYIDGATSENTYPYKDELKNRFGAKWLRNIGQYGAWGWYLGGNPESDAKVFDTKINPCVKWLTSVEQPQENGEKRDVEKVIDELRGVIVNGNYEVIGTNSTGDIKTMSKADIENRLDELKESLVNAMSSEEFMERLAPIIKNRQAMGYQFSLKNTILIWIQDPEAKDVRSRTDWDKLNRKVKPNATAVGLFVRVGNKKYKSKEAREIATRAFLGSVGKKSEEELTPGEKERLRHELNSTSQSSGGFKFMYNFFDVRFTEQKEGEEDLYGERPSSLEWNNAEADENELMADYIDAAITVAREKYQLQVNFKPAEDLGGAMGYATYNGEIVLPENFKKNASNLSTVVHEMSHCLLHFKYAHSKNPELKSYFVGTSQGRELVEQQAEISAYIILRQLGVDEEMGYQMNYIAGWGGDAKNAAKVFDMVAAAANEITDQIINVLKTRNNEEV